MRQVAARERIERVMRALGQAARAETRIYFTGGATAVLLGWRETTMDVDLDLVPQRDELLRAIAALKDDLDINIELASPAHFIPPPPGWDARSAFIRREGPVTFLHYDFYAQALAKIERGHAQDCTDVSTMLREGLIEPAILRQLFETIVPQLYRYPALDERAFRTALDDTLEKPWSG